MPGKFYSQLLGRRLHMYLAYFKKYGRLPNLRKPVLFSEKMLWAKLHGNLGSYGCYVDKYEVRKYVEETVGVEVLNTLYGVYRHTNEIDFETFPKAFVLKATHGCGFNLVCRDKNDLNIAKARRTIDGWLKYNWYFDSKEPQYKDIVPRVVCEAYLEDETGQLRDFKFFCFNGRVEFIQVLFDRDVELKRVFKGRDWQTLNIKFAGEGNFCRDINKPANLDRMISVAEKLAARFGFVRVDLYNVNNKIYFGELTFTPAGGIAEIEPKSESVRLAESLPW